MIRRLPVISLVNSRDSMPPVSEHYISSRISSRYPCGCSLETTGSIPCAEKHDDVMNNEAPTSRIVLNALPTRIAVSEDHR